MFFGKAAHTRDAVRFGKEEKYESNRHCQKD